MRAINRAPSNLGQSFYATVAAVSTTPIASLSGSATLDSYVANNNDLVLLTGQSTPSQNGLWIVNTSGSWMRPSIAVAPVGGLVLVKNGTAFSNTVWVNQSVITTIDSSSQSWNFHNYKAIKRVGNSTGLIWAIIMS